MCINTDFGHKLVCNAKDFTCQRLHFLTFYSNMNIYTLHYLILRTLAHFFAWQTTFLNGVKTKSPEAKPKSSNRCFRTKRTSDKVLPIPSTHTANGHTHTQTHNTHTHTHTYINKTRHIQQNHIYCTDAHNHSWTQQSSLTSLNPIAFIILK